MIRNENENRIVDGNNIQSYFLDVDKPELNIEKVEKDVFEYFGCPSDYAFSLDYFIEKCMQEYGESLEYQNEEKRHTTQMTEEEIKEDNKKDIQKMFNLMNKTLEYSEDIKRVYLQYNYPLSREVYHQFNVNDGNKLNYGNLLQLYTIGFQEIYNSEENVDGHPGYISGMLNRQNSNGPYGIWGHDLEDLVYNGYSTIQFGKDGEGVMSVLCSFNCDS